MPIGTRFTPRSRHEYLVRDYLFSKSWRVFLPERTVWSRRRDRRKQIQVPLFPGYLFVSSSGGAKRLRDVSIIRGVVRLLGAGGSPLPVSRREVASLRLLVASGELLRQTAYLVPGSRVRVVEGPLAGAEGTVARFGRKRHLIVSVELMQRSVAVELAEWQL
ncbi:MAG: transcriptional antiterminator, partial [Candidatus Tectomicrobia bacterium]|nr:transcriptional antiterminator [Candidatus Tectomicrobia bacterium]